MYLNNGTWEYKGQPVGQPTEEPTTVQEKLDGARHFPQDVISRLRQQAKDKLRREDKNRRLMELYRGHYHRSSWANEGHNLQQVAKSGRCPYSYVARPKVGWLFNHRAWWVGFHWSSFNRRLCVNILPCFTVWLVLRGGKVPTQL